MGDRIEVPLDLADLEVVRSDVVGHVRGDVESSFPRACYHCGSVGVIVYSRRVRDCSTVTTSS